MIKFEHSVVINRPVGEVFDFMKEPENTPMWDQVIQKSERTSAGPVGVGTTGRTQSKFLGREIESTWEITEYEEGRRRALKSTSGPIGINVVDLFEPVEGGTKLTRIGQYEVGGFFKLAEPVVARMGRRQAESNLENLKDLLEAKNQ